MFLMTVLQRIVYAGYVVLDKVNIVQGRLNLLFFDICYLCLDEDCLILLQFLFFCASFFFIDSSKLDFFTFHV